MYKLCQKFVFLRILSKLSPIRYRTFNRYILTKLYHTHYISKPFAPIRGSDIALLMLLCPTSHCLYYCKHDLCVKSSAIEETLIKTVRFNFLTCKKDICGTFLVPLGLGNTYFVRMKYSLFE